MSNTPYEEWIDRDALMRRFEAYTAQQSLFIDYVQEEMNDGNAQNAT